MPRRNSSQMILHFKQLEKYQNEYYPDNLNLSFLQIYLLARSIVPHFSAKKESVIILKMKNVFLYDFKKTHLFLILVNKEIFFQEYTEMELKRFFIIFEGIFEWKN